MKERGALPLRPLQLDTQVAFEQRRNVNGPDQRTTAPEFDNLSLSDVERPHATVNVP